jgi:formylglycine-generating enzyme required for sulfatase activity
MMKGRTISFIALAVVIFFSGMANAAERVALVIGNSSYRHVRRLPNPKNDARAIARLLTKMGFLVTRKNNLGYNAMRKVLRDFGHQARGTRTALIYYAGHGMELGGENYLIPVDARLHTDGDLEFEAVRLSSLMRTTTGASKLKLVILDACRNNPFSAKMALSSGNKRSVSRGLGRVEPSGDVLVAYAAKAGTQADDGKGKHSPYAQALLDHLATPGLDIRLLFGKVRDKVMSSTGQTQEPFIYGSLGGDAIYLLPRKADTHGTENDELATMRKRLALLEAEQKRWQQQKSQRNEKEPKPATDSHKSIKQTRKPSRKKKAKEQKVAVGIFPRQPIHPISRSFEPELVRIPRGIFLMGCTTQKDCLLTRFKDDIFNDEKPLHKVKIDSFYMSKYETTLGQWKACVSDGGCKQEAEDKQSGPDNLPAVNVSWHDAVDFAKWLSKKTGKTWRLPTEAEWEYAGRGKYKKKNPTKYSFGNRETDLEQYAWYGKNSDNRVHPVGRKNGNSFGLHDMHGNIWEWILDRYGKYEQGYQKNPQGPELGVPRAARGGSWKDTDAGKLRSAKRNYFSPTSRGADLGFRLVRER